MRGGASLRGVTRANDTARGGETATQRRCAGEAVGQKLNLLGKLFREKIEGFHVVVFNVERMAKILHSFSFEDSSMPIPM
jgi:hypothetical protein